jgi:hypothetical protein
VRRVAICKCAARAPRSCDDRAAVGQDGRDLELKLHIYGKYDLSEQYLPWIWVHPDPHGPTAARSSQLLGARAAHSGCDNTQDLRAYYV